MACEIPDQGLNLRWECSLSHWTTREVPVYRSLKIQYLWNLEEEKAVIQVFEISHVGDFPGGPVAKTVLPLQGARV